MLSISSLLPFTALLILHLYCASYALRLTIGGKLICRQKPTKVANVKVQLWKKKTAFYETSDKKVSIEVSTDLYGYFEIDFPQGTTNLNAQDRPYLYIEHNNCRPEGEVVRFEAKYTNLFNSKMNYLIQC